MQANWLEPNEHKYSTTGYRSSERRTSMSARDKL